MLASEGSLTVTTRNQRIALRPARNGTTTVVGVKPVKFPVGTGIEIGFGPALPRDEGALLWARSAVRMAQGETYSGKTSPWWYDAAQFHELLDACGDRPVRELVSQLDGCTGNKAGEIVAAAGLNRATCSGVTRAQAERLLLAAREYAKPVSSKRLGAVGADLYSNMAYACVYGTAEFGAVEPLAEIPFVVEAWAAPINGKTYLHASVNRTPVTGSIRAARDKRDIDVFGCGLAHTVVKVSADAQFLIHVNVITPFMPITSDGKEPDLRPFLSEITAAIGKAVRKAHRPNGGSGTTQKDVVLDNLRSMPERTAKMSEWLMALCFEPRGLALCELRHARFPLSISLWRNAFNSRAGNFELLEPTAKIFQFVIRTAREVSGFAPLRNGFIHESRSSETVANNGDFGETKADFRCVLLGHKKSHVLPPGTRPRRRWIRFIKATGFMSAVSATSSTAAVWMSPLGGRSLAVR